MARKETKSSYQLYEEASSLNKLKVPNELCDLKLKAKDGTEIKVHKVVMSSASGYFRSLLTSGMKESFTDCIEFKDINGDILSKIVTFIYQGHLENDKVEDIGEMIKHADYFQITQLVDWCTSVLEEIIDSNSCLKYWRLSQKHLIPKLEDICITYILNSPYEMFRNSSFLDELTLEEMKTLLADDRLLYYPEFTFESVIDWSKRTTNSTKEFREVFPQIINLINFRSEEKEFIQSKIVTGIGAPKKKFLAITENVVYEVCSKGTLKCFCKRKLNTPGFGCTTFDRNLLLVCGGCKNRGITPANSSEYFSPITKEWKAFPAIKSNRCYHACTSTENKIYVCGGDSDFGKSLKSIEIFDLGKEEWYIGPEMKTSRACFGLATINQTLYAVGGCKTIEMLDPRTQQGWITVLESFPFDKYSYTKCLSFDKSIHCFTFDHKCVFEPRMNKCSTSEPTSIKLSEGFDICSLYDEYGALCVGYYGQQATKGVRFFKFDKNEGITLESNKNCLNFYKTSALVALYY